MNDPVLTCQDEQRREKIRVSERFNGVDFLEVSQDQLKLTVVLLRKASPDLIERFKDERAKAHIVIEGGRKIRDVEVEEVVLKHVEEADKDDFFEIAVNKPGDFSTYALRFIDLDERGRPTGQPLPEFDPRYTALPFSFKSDCPSDVDCKPKRVCPPDKLSAPEINYLAKDYASFRQLILDRLAQIMPEWRERHIPDLGIALVELMAYIGDYLSYFQDAVATEAYLDTARKRISVRRHARLVDYLVHEGCNARAWVHIEVGLVEHQDLTPSDFFLITGFGNVPEPGKILKPADLLNIPAGRYKVFEPLVEHPEAPIRLYAAHNKIRFYTWENQVCCLPKGATSATLRDEWVSFSGRNGEQQRSEMPNSGADIVSREEREHMLHLQVGDFLIFEEVIGPKTGKCEDADPDHRHVVRLTKVQPGVDELCDVPVVEIEWAEADALPFPICISTVGPPLECEMLEDISIARGNVLLVDHGRRIEDEELGEVPLKTKEIICEREGRPSDTRFIPGPFRPILQEAPLTYSVPPPASDTPASKVLIQDPRKALPQIKLTSRKFETVDTVLRQWHVRQDLLGSQRDDLHFVVETDEDRRAHLRFGDGELGSAPEPGMRFQATYRIGNGPSGNVGAERITHLVHRTTALSNVTLKPHNPFPAHGGRIPEPLSEVKLFAPTAFRKLLERAITTDDYARLAEQNPKVQRASATLRWTGSWYEVLVAIDPFGAVVAEKELIEEIERHLFRFRRMGHDLKVRLAEFVPLDIAMDICVLPGYTRGHVKSALLEVFSSGLRSDGSPGFFHPDKLTFGQSIRLSRLIAVAQAVKGVESVQVTKLERLFEGPNKELDNGILPIHPFEIARLDNDPSFPENGRLELTVRGGR
ncbi:putative baseplate assembly protein [candidate division KSB1 bacterium]|nr:putative baseplate assembly protein [candidate division KSB1 bacterium]